MLLNCIDCIALNEIRRWS